MKPLLFVIVWNCILTGFLAYLLIVEFRSSSSNTQTQAETSRQITTLASTLDVVQNNVVDLNQTTTKTVQSLTIGYDGNDVYMFIDMQGTNTLNGFLYTNDTATVNITDVITTINSTEANTTRLFYEFHVSAISCCSRVFIDSDLSTICLLSELTDPSVYVCSTIQMACRYITLFTLNTDPSHKNKVTLYLSYGSVCAN